MFYSYVCFLKLLCMLFFTPIEAFLLLCMLFLLLCMLFYSYVCFFTPMYASLLLCMRFLLLCMLFYSYVCFFNPMYAMRHNRLITRYSTCVFSLADYRVHEQKGGACAVRMLARCYSSSAATVDAFQCGGIETGAATTYPFHDRRR